MRTSAAIKRHRRRSRWGQQLTQNRRIEFTMVVEQTRSTKRNTAGSVRIGQLLEKSRV